MHSDGVEDGSLSVISITKIKYKTVSIKMKYNN